MGPGLAQIRGDQLLSSTVTLYRGFPLESLNPTTCIKSVKVVSGRAMVPGYGSGPKNFLDCANAPGGEYTLILSVLGWRCRGGVTGYAVGTGGTSWSNCDVPFEKRLRTLLPVRWSIDRVDRPPSEDSFAFVGRRRKSVRVE